ncbi:MAG: beta-agarase [Terriglobia bacterium]|jgi:agarase
MNRLWALLCLLAFVAQPVSAQYDTYGGWTKIKGQKAGFFHAERIGGRWWLVTPKGNVFFSKGVCNINANPESKSAPPPPADTSKWAAETARLLKGWNFNTAGAWSVELMSSQGLVYTPVLDIAAGERGELWLKGGIPDYFSPEFRQAADRAAARGCQPRANDPWLLGYFTDNELRWGADWRSKESLLQTYLKMPPTAPGYQKAIEFLKARGHTPQNLDEDDQSSFLEITAGEYARIAREAIRRYDPNHLILGCRFAGYASEAVLRGMAPYFDVISYNNYSPDAPVEKLRQIFDLTGKPTMITEFSFKAMDSGLPNTKGAAKPVATQRDRAEGFTRYVEALAGLPSCVGYHWFEYRDEPAEGRFDGENSNYGLVKIDLTPWTMLTDRMKEVNSRIETLAAKSAERGR